ALVYAAMEEAMGAGMHDMRDMEAYAAALLGGCDVVRGKTVLVHGFDLLPERRMQTLAAVAKAAAAMHMTFEAEAEGELFAGQWRNLQKLEKTLSAAGVAVEKHRLSGIAREREIAHLMENLYAYPYARYGGKVENIRLIAAEDREQEVTYVAERILSETCEGGLRMRQLGVMTADVAGYGPVIRDVFGRCGIPFFMEEKRTLKESSLGIFLTSALDVLRSGRWRAADVLRHMKAGFLPVSREETDILQNHIREYGLKGWALKKPLLRGDEQLEDIRTRGAGPLLALQEEMKNNGPSGRALLAYLDALSAEEKLEQQADEMDALGLPGEARFLRQVYAKTRDLLLQVDTFAGRRDLADLRDVIAAGLESAAVAVVPPRVDEVVVGDITHSIFPLKEHIFVLGANDGILPPLPAEGGLISEYEVEKLRQEQPNFPDRPTFDDMKAHIRRGLYGGKKLTVSYSAADGLPSQLIDRILRLFPAAAVESAGEVQVRSARGGMEALAKELRRRMDGQSMEESLIPAYIKEDKQRLLSLLPGLTFENRPAQLQPAAARQLYGQRRANVSAIEQYYQCPYKHFVRYGLRPKEVREYEEDAREAGTYVHALMDGFAKNLKKNRLRWAEVDDEQIADLMAHTAGECMDEHNRGIFSGKRFAFTEKRLREEAVLAARAVRGQLAGTGVDVNASEQSFGFQGGYVLHTPHGDIALRGKIDRVDAAEIGGETYLRVVDYKTGEKRFSMASAYYGLNIQLPVYLMAVLAY
ncbi:MAG: PD-(D/E)XK nuclease family protein, partial [Christensenellaceae bacterium]|nr:PD-(D/E)XK nuclease family protein [Christensenellaceae bacterium]